MLTRRAGCGLSRQPWRLLPALCVAACTRANVEVLRVDDLGALPTSATIKARDGGYSARVGDRSVWFYGDTVLSLEGEDGSSWRDNTWSWTDDLDLSDGVDGFTEPVDALGAPREFFPETDEEAAYNAAQGPWSDPLRVHATLDAVDGWPYAGIAHPEFEGGGILFTYFRSTGDWTGEIHALRVVLGPRG